MNAEQCAGKIFSPGHLGLRADSPRVIQLIQMAINDQTAELQAIVDKLYKTSDGVSITPEMTIVCRRGHESLVEPHVVGSYLRCIHRECAPPYIQGPDDPPPPPNWLFWATHHVHDCFSSIEAWEAAEAAKEEDARREDQAE